MPDYLLPCKCGQKTAVSTARAGEVIRCLCGAELLVPTMRGLRELELADPADRPKLAWNDRHRIAFLLILGAAGCALIAAYLWFTLPLVPELPTEEQYHAAVERVSPSDLLDAHRRMLQGLHSPAMLESPVVKTRQMMLWGIAIVSILALALLGCAGITVFNRPSQKVSKPASRQKEST